MLAIVVIAAVALAAGGTWRFARRGERRHGLLMVVAALVLIGNALIWAWPVAR
ncbi:hypothetical protein [uncultured Sphingomonas sp.]|uniref:hypothetical protein n=1 Tax=uncultured Sphingomonas sp. TaxID=158754 RepID=UPI0025D8D00E|nr:hypothetical protein [uncultured Sphingomonas sp.]